MPKSTPYFSYTFYLYSLQFSPRNRNIPGVSMSKITVMVLLILTTAERGMCVEMNVPAGSTVGLRNDRGHVRVSKREYSIREFPFVSTKGKVNLESTQQQL